MLVIPPITGGLHCGDSNGWDRDGVLHRHPAHYGRAPLRLTSFSGMWLLEGTVIPPITGGLHCGTRHGMHRDTGTWCHPAHYGRAPLRLVSHLAGWGNAYMSSRPLRAGSIAATSTAGTVTECCIASSRPLRAGSIAAASFTLQDDAGWFVIPPITGGLHCGSYSGYDREGYNRSSRPLRAGSIAARTPRLTE